MKSAMKSLMTGRLSIRIFCRKNTSKPMTTASPMVLPSPRATPMRKLVHKSRPGRSRYCTYSAMRVFSIVRVSSSVTRSKRSRYSSEIGSFPSDASDICEFVGLDAFIKQSPHRQFSWKTILLLYHEIGWCETCKKEKFASDLNPCNPNENAYSD